MAFVRTQRDASVFFCAACLIFPLSACRPHGPRALSAGRLSCASVLFCPSPLASVRSSPARLYNRMVFVGALHATPSPQGVAFPIILLQPNGLRRGAACNALAPPAHLSAEWLSYGRNVMRPYNPFGTTCRRCDLPFVRSSPARAARP